MHYLDMANKLREDRLKNKPGYKKQEIVKPIVSKPRIPRDLPAKPHSYIAYARYISDNVAIGTCLTLKEILVHLDVPEPINTHFIEQLNAKLKRHGIRFSKREDTYTLCEKGPDKIYDRRKIL